MDLRRESRLLQHSNVGRSAADVACFVSEAGSGLFRSRGAPADADMCAIGNGIDLGFYDPVPRSTC